MKVIEKCNDIVDLINDVFILIEFDTPKHNSYDLIKTGEKIETFLFGQNRMRLKYILF